MEKIYAKIKSKPEDFIVEEIAEKWNCSISDKWVKQEIQKADKQFLWCEMEKIDIDHFSAMKILSEKISTMPSNIGYAGTKDKRAWTSQRISIEKPNLEKIKNFAHEKIYLKNFKWNKRKIKLGYLEANKFTITIRQVTDTKPLSKIKKTKDFANFFGKQRFGTTRKNNVEIGKLILKKQFKEAVMKILTDTSEKEKPEVQEARKRLLQEKDFEKAKKYFPCYLKLENQIIRYLARKKQDYVGALKRANRKNILMYVHSVQSKIFNEILEKCLQENLKPEKIMLPGFRLEFSPSKLGKIEKQVLKENNLELRDFNLIEISYLRLKGTYRKAFSQVKDLEIITENDELNKDCKKIILKFTLPKGNYATTFLNQFFEFI